MDIDAAYDRCLQDVRAHYENFPVASLLVPRGCGRMSRPSMPLRVRPTTSPTKATEAPTSAWPARCLAPPARVGGPFVSATGPLAVGEPPHADAIFLALGTSIRRLDLPVSCLEDLLSAFEQDVRVATTNVGRRARLLPAIGQSRSAGWCCALPASRRAARCVVRLHLHGAAAHEFLAGFRRSTSIAAASICRGRFNGRTLPASKTCAAA